MAFGRHLDPVLATPDAGTERRLTPDAGWRSRSRLTTPTRQPKNARASSYSSGGTVFSTATASAIGTSAMSLPRSAAI